MYPKLTCIVVLEVILSKIVYLITFIIQGIKSSIGEKFPWIKDIVIWRLQGFTITIRKRVTHVE
jgi:hypothetical protein